MDAEGLIQAVLAMDPAVGRRDKSDRPAVRVPPEHLVQVMRRLREESEFAFDMLLDHTAIDWIEQGTMEAVYSLYSTVHGHHLMVTSTVPRDNPVVPTVSGVWEIARWQEREAYDLLGVLYDHHEDLRRVFLEDNWAGHPLRKDYKDDDMLELPK